MRALAIVGPRGEERDLVPFRKHAEISTAQNLEQAAMGEPPGAVLVLGGDGTLQRHLAELVQTRIPLLVVPTGSANDFARALGLRSRADAVQAWKKFLQGNNNLRLIDLGLIRFAGERDQNESAYFSCAVGAGVDAEVARQANSLPRWLRGNGGYFLAAIPALMRFQATPITVTATQADGKRRTISESGILAAAANAPRYGHGMNIAPLAELDDGQLEICFVRRIGKLRLLRLFPSVYRGTHVGLPEVEYFRAARLRIESEKPLAVHADGEAIGMTPLEVRMAPRALRVIV